MTVTTALDPSFGQRGLVLGAVTSGNTQDSGRPTALAVQADGKIVEVGKSRPDVIAPAQNQLYVRRLNADSSPDTTFGTGGQLAVPAPSALSVAVGAPSEVFILADGSILFVTTFEDTSTTAGDSSAVVIKVTPAGSLDANFGLGGEVVLPASGEQFLTAMDVQLDGQIVVATSSTDRLADNNVTYTLTLARYSPTGVLDTTFGQGGIATLKPPQSAAPDAYSHVNIVDVVALPGGGIVLAGDTTSYLGPDVVRIESNVILVRFGADGSLDTGFGDGGFATPTAGSSTPFLTGMAAQPDGKILLAGEAPSSRGPAPFLVRLLSDGSVDPTFATGPVGVAYRMVVGTDGGVTVAGVVGPRSTSSPIFVQRFLPNGNADLTFGTRGRTNFRLNSPLRAANPDDYQLVSVDALALTSGGALLVASHVNALFSQQAALARLLPIAVSPTPGDYDGDGASDPAVLLPNGLFAYRTAAGDTLVDLSGGASNQTTLPAAGDYDGDGVTDPAAYLPTGLARLRYHTANHPNAFVIFGASGAGQTVPAPGDYDGDGKTDVAAYLPGLGQFAIRTDTLFNPGDLFVPFGIPGAGQTIPAPGDYDGDGKTDIAAYLPSLGILAYRPSSGGTDVYASFGLTGNQATIPAPGDYDGDGKTDVAAYLPGLGVLAYRPSSGGPDVLTGFGIAGPGASIPAPGDYDGDGRTDLAVYLPQLAILAYRPSSGGFDVLQSFGAPGTGVTVPAASIPYAQPPTVSGMSLAASRPEAGVPVALTDDVLELLAGTKKKRS